MAGAFPPGTYVYPTKDPMPPAGGDGLPPPPCYESVVGAHTLLGFQDFWPKCINNEQKAKHAVFEDFNCIMRIVNLYLSSNPNLAVFSIETIEKKVYSTGAIYSQLTVFVPSGTSATWIKGLRLWFTQNLSSEAQQIGYRDVIPRSIATSNKEYLNFENFQELVNNFNREVEYNGIMGRILSIQTVHINIDKTSWVHGCNQGGFQAGHATVRCAWPDDFKYHRFYFMRVFFEQSSFLRQEKIGIADFQADILEKPGFFDPKPKMSDFSVVVQKAAAWMKNFNGVRVTNLQTVETLLLHSGNNGPQTTLTCMDYNMHRGNRLRGTFLRIAFVQADTGSIPQTPTLTYHALYPLHNDNDQTGHWETLSQSQQRIKSWLQGTGAKLICVETVYQNTQVHKKCPNEVRTVYDGDWYIVQSKNNTSYIRYKMLQHVRVYIDGVLNPNQSPERAGYYAGEQTDDGCTLL